jgi:hypothetical protein
MLDSGFYENVVWGALHKAWKGYVIAKNKGEDDKMKLYARRIQELQHDLGLEVSSFPNIGMSATSFFWQLAQEENDSQKQQVAAEEQNYLGDSHMSERNSLTHIAKISKTMKIKMIGSPMTIMRILQIS